MIAQQLIRPCLASAYWEREGRGPSTDSAGRYTIRVAKTDSIYFSYLGKVHDKVRRTKNLLLAIPST